MRPNGIAGRRQGIPRKGVFFLGLRFDFRLGAAAVKPAEGLGIIKTVLQGIGIYKHKSVGNGHPELNGGFPLAFVFGEGRVALSQSAQLVDNQQYTNQRKPE
jgi:hypothetical protein